MCAFILLAVEEAPTDLCLFIFDVQALLQCCLQRQSESHSSSPLMSIAHETAPSSVGGGFSENCVIVIQVWHYIGE